MNYRYLPALMLICVLVLITVDRFWPRVQYWPSNVPTPIEKLGLENKRLQRQLKLCLAGKTNSDSQIQEPKEAQATPEPQQQREFLDRIEFQKRAILIAQISFSLLFGGVSVWVWLSKRFKPTEKYFAFTIIGLIISYWLRGPAGLPLFSR